MLALRPVASSASDATVRDVGEAWRVFRSVVAVLVSFAMPPIEGKWVA